MFGYVNKAWIKEGTVLFHRIDNIKATITKVEGECFNVEYDRPLFGEKTGRYDFTAIGIHLFFNEEDVTSEHYDKGEHIQIIEEKNKREREKKEENRRRRIEKEKEERRRAKEAKEKDIIENLMQKHRRFEELFWLFEEEQEEMKEEIARENEDYYMGDSYFEETPIESEQDNAWWKMIQANAEEWQKCQIDNTSAEESRMTLSGGIIEDYNYYPSNTEVCSLEKFRKLVEEKIGKGYRVSEENIKNYLEYKHYIERKKEPNRTPYATALGKACGVFPILLNSGKWETPKESFVFAIPVDETLIEKIANYLYKNQLYLYYYDEEEEGGNGVYDDAEKGEPYISGSRKDSDDENAWWEMIEKSGQDTSNHYDTGYRGRYTHDNRNISYNNSRKESIESIIRKRGIKRIVHFSRIQNLGSILSKGIIPRDHLNSYSNASVNDEIRMDGKTDCSCFSVTYANNRLLYYYDYNRRKSSWVILCLDPQIIIDKNCYFVETNAASGKKKRTSWEDYQTANAFDGMFAEVIEGKELITRSSQKNLPNNATTDEQAEILIQGRVSQDYIREILFQSKSDMEGFLLRNPRFKGDNRFKVDENAFWTREKRVSMDSWR